MAELYIEPFSGIAGDMFLSALCSLADYHDEITHLPQKLNLPDAKVEIEVVNKNGIVCKHVRIIDLNSNHPTIDHHHHEGTDHGHPHHHHRHLRDILKLIDRGDIPEPAKQIAKEIFTIIGESEAKIHNMDLDKIHFHEVSAVDSILDIVGCAVLIDLLKINKTICDPICTGFGMVQTQHGLLPVPAPATADLLKSMPTYAGSEEGERVTPTGAAILKYLKPSFEVGTITKAKIGYGPGSKDFIGPNVVRVSIIKSLEAKNATEHLMLVETNIDDTTPEFLGLDFQEGLLSQGAIDYYLTPIQMKKGRSGLKLSVLVASDNLQKLNAWILDNTSSIGVRYHPVDRTTLHRTHFEMDSPYGQVNVKQVITPSGSLRNKIEYDTLIEISKQSNIPVSQLQLELYALLFKKQEDNTNNL